MILDALPRRVKVVEVGPRDGLENEAHPVSTERKAAFVDLLSAVGYEEIEVTSFVNPSKVPQLADAELVLGKIRRRPGVIYSALVPNKTGLDRALAAGVDRIAVFTAASETFNKRNIGASIEESFQRFEPVVAGAHAAGIGVRAYISTAFVCPFEGMIPPAKTREVAARLMDLGVEEISIGDTVGAAVPSQIDRLLDELEGVVPVERIALHLHDTRATALSNVLTGLLRGVRIFDSAAGGLGGCPFAPGATGNLATEDLLYFLDGLGIYTGLDRIRLRDACDLIEGVLGRRLPSRIRRAGMLPVRAA